MKAALYGFLQRRQATGEGPLEFKHKREARRRQAQNKAREARKAVRNGH